MLLELTRSIVGLAIELLAPKILKLKEDTSKVTKIQVITGYKKKLNLEYYQKFILGVLQNNRKYFSQIVKDLCCRGQVF